MADDYEKPKKSDAKDVLAEARKAFQMCEDAEADNRKSALEDIEFARKGVQWPDNIRKKREQSDRPCLTINKMPAFIRQVVNDARQNKPSIKVHPADSGADPETAEIINGIIRNIEYSSNADVAYDTGTECAVSGGFGYWRVGLDYAYDDAFDMDLTIDRIANPFSVYGDPHSTAADSSDWNLAFIVDRKAKDEFRREYPDAECVDWDDDAWNDAPEWIDEKSVLVAEWWTREKVDRPIVLTTDGRVFDKEQLATDPDLQIALQNGVIQINGERITKSCKVTQRIMTGAEILKTTNWLGKYIPIVPVYGDEFDIEGKRYLRSLIHSAIDAQRMFNYWRSASTELVALAPRVPYIGPKKAFDSDIERWNTANTENHAFLEYDGPVAPQRQPLDMGVAAGALQEALNASDDMKAIIGLYDASLGARSNETSGKAIMARQREGDVATFHFIDNMARAIRHTGRILLDLIPKVYDTPRIVRVIGEDGSQEAKPINQQYPQVDPKTGEPVVDEMGNAVLAMHDITAGKYDLIVSTGPSFTSRREEAAMQMTEMIRALPAAAPILGKHLAKNLDWPGADDIAEELDQMSSGQIPPQIQQQIEEGQKKIQQLTEENQSLKLDKAAEREKIAAQAAADELKIQSAERVKVMEIKSKERLAEIEIATNARIDAMKAKAAADNAAEANRMKASQQNSRQSA